MSDLDRAIQRAQDYFLRCQHPQGYWVGELESDVSVTAGYIPLFRFMGLRDDRRQEKVANFLKAKQLPDGSWAKFWGGPGDRDVSIQAYFALKLAGFREQEFMLRARDFILAQGGVEQAHTFTKILLAHFGQFPWERLPLVPPELVLLPNASPFNIYDFASWARATIVALTVLTVQRPVHPLAREYGIEELNPGRNHYRRTAPPVLSWGNAFLGLDALFKAWQRLPVKPARSQALAKARDWLIAHQEGDGSWGGIMLPWVYSLMALKSLGFANEHSVIAQGLKGLEGFVVEEDSCLRLQPAVSPVWDTAWVLLSLAESGLAPSPALAQAASWLLGQQVLVPGDWKVKNPRAEPGGWSFEFYNSYYPDIDDTSLVSLALSKLDGDDIRKKEAINKAVGWVLSMQSKDGGWAAFDRDNNRAFLRQVPFADFMTPLDPTSPDVTGHVLELLGHLGNSRQPLPLAKALDYLKREQKADGSWYGRWGVNFIYGTSAVLCGLKAVGEDMAQDYITKATDWLKARQNGDGGWGETCLSYADEAPKSIGPSTPSQTAWALLGLVAAQDSSPAVAKGVDYLLRMQREDGSWAEEAFTGTGFPRAFYLRYHYYCNYFPLLALNRVRASLRRQHDG